jgi:hypothetical protein
MLAFLWRATRGHRLRPWRSPYLRWRIETYWGIGAEGIGPAEFWRFAGAHWRELLRYLRWAGRMRREAARRGREPFTASG